MLSLPYSIAAVGLVPGVICIVFLGIVALYTSYLLIEFKLRHPRVHTMGDAGFILFGPIGREVLAAGTLIFVIFATGGQLLAGQIALASLSDQKLCNVLYTGMLSFEDASATTVCELTC
jgi:amino acid permease